MRPTYAALVAKRKRENQIVSTSPTFDVAVSRISAAGLYSNTAAARAAVSRSISCGTELKGTK